MGRVVLDGVVDIDDYMEANWSRNLLDAEKIVEYFYQSCFDAAERCPLTQSSDKSYHDIKERVDKFINATDEHPISFLPTDGTANVRVITGYDIRNVFIAPLYKPEPTLFEELAIVLAEALKGNYTLLGANIDLPRLQDACSVNDSTPYTFVRDAQTAILCGDASAPKSGQQPRNFSFWKSYVARLVGQSSTVGHYWSNIASSCTGWRITPKWIFSGPWVTPPANKHLSDDAPAAPLLL